MPARANQCGLPLGAGVGAAMLTSSVRPSTLSSASTPIIANAFISIGFLGGMSSSSGTIMGIGPEAVANRAFSCFMTSDLPLAVSALPGTRSIMRLVPSPSRTMTLEWTNSDGPLPVTYNVFLGTSSIGLSGVADGVQLTSDLTNDLQYNTPYYWQVSAVDEFGRTATSDIYTFSIVPTTDHLIAAPNPMHPGHGSTTFLFMMNGAGMATMDIYSLPDVRHVFSRTYTGLQDGANTIAYDGTDDNGRYLPNGVFTVIMRKMGANGNETERFKLVTAR